MSKFPWKEVGGTYYYQSETLGLVEYDDGVLKFKYTSYFPQSLEEAEEKIVEQLGRKVNSGKENLDAAQKVYNGVKNELANLICTTI